MNIKDIRQTAMDLLARREHSCCELMRKLKARDFVEEEINPILDELINRGWLSDERFTEAYTQMRIKRGYGPIRIQQELLERGVEDEIIEKHLNKNDEQWIGLANEVRQKKFGLTIPFSFQDQSKQMRFLQYRGFTLDQIHQVF